MTYNNGNNNEEEDEEPVYGDYPRPKKTKRQARSMRKIRKVDPENDDNELAYAPFKTTTMAQYNEDDVGNTNCYYKKRAPSGLFQYWQRRRTHSLSPKHSGVFSPRNRQSKGFHKPPKHRQSLAQKKGIKISKGIQRIAANNNNNKPTEGSPTIRSKDKEVG